jgi:D-alanyl-D-alanine carboxypeptidase
MTAILAIESGIPLQNTVCVPSEAVGVEGSSIYLEKGEEITLEALLYGLLLCSANDASIVIAITVSGSVDAFVEKMNEKAQEIGLTDTNFKNPHGLFESEHYTTAKDLALLKSYCIKNETFLKISGTKKRIFPKGDDKTRVMINHNRLLDEDIGVISGKTGYTQKSGRCLVSVAQRDGMTLICVTLNASDDWNDHKKLYNYAFSKPYA